MNYTHEPKVKLCITLPSIGSVTKEPYADEFPKYLPSYQGGRSRFLSTEEIHAAMDDAFSAEQMRVLKEYFDKGSPFYPTGLTLFVLGIDKDNALASGLVEVGKNINGFKVRLFDKVFVIRKYQGNGIGPRMIYAANEINPKENVPAILKTSIPNAHNTYLEVSDISGEFDGYNVHGFKFLDKATQEELFKDARKKFQMAAREITATPKTVVPLERLVEHAS